MKKKKILKVFDFGIWNNYEDQGEERNSVVAQSRIEAQKLYKKYFKQHYPHSESGEYSLDFYEGQEVLTTDDLDIPNKKGVY